MQIWYGLYGSGPGHKNAVAAQAHLGGYDLRNKPERPLLEEIPIVGTFEKRMLCATASRNTRIPEDVFVNQDIIVIEINISVGIEGKCKFSGSDIVVIICQVCVPAKSGMCFIALIKYPLLVLGSFIKQHGCEQECGNIFHVAKQVVRITEISPGVNVGFKKDESTRVNIHRVEALSIKRKSESERFGGKFLIRSFWGEHFSFEIWKWLVNHLLVIGC